MAVKVSILLPSYNHADFLPTCLERVLAQSYSNWEIVAIDDQSTDESFDILRRYQNDRIHVSLNDQNLGTYGTLAKAAQQAKGEYLAILNSDDVWEPEKLQRQVELLSRHQECGYCYTLGWRIDEHGAIDQTSNDHEGWPTSELQDLLPLLLDENRVLASSVLIRRSIADIQPTLRYSGDWRMLLAASKIAPCVCVPERLTYWRMHSHNTFRRSPGQTAEEVSMREWILSKPDQWELPRIPRSVVRHGLSRCALHLSALYVLQGRMSDARAAARMSVRMKAGKASIKRLAIVSLPEEVARKHLWGGQ